VYYVGSVLGNKRYKGSSFVRLEGRQKIIKNSIEWVMKKGQSAKGCRATPTNSGFVCVLSYDSMMLGEI
jgi:hypothetical protein